MTYYSAHKTGHCPNCGEDVKIGYGCLSPNCPMGGENADPSRGVLNERGSTHGDFTENGKIMQSLKVLMREHWGWSKLDTSQREALEMIQHKIGRILCGNNNYFDHWRDIAGYAKLIEERCPKSEETQK
jgi:hypothetical protein